MNHNAFQPARGRRRRSKERKFVGGNSVEHFVVVSPNESCYLAFVCVKNGNYELYGIKVCALEDVLSIRKWKCQPCTKRSCVFPVVRTILGPTRTLGRPNTKVLFLASWNANFT